MQDFRQLLVWQKAHQLCLKADALTGVFPKSEQLGLTRQMLRAAVTQIFDLLCRRACGFQIRATAACDLLGRSDQSGKQENRNGTSTGASGHCARSAGFQPAGRRPARHQPLEKRRSERHLLCRAGSARMRPTSTGPVFPAFLFSRLSLRLLVSRGKCASVPRRQPCPPSSDTPKLGSHLELARDLTFFRPPTIGSRSTCSSRSDACSPFSSKSLPPIAAWPMAEG